MRFRLFGTGAGRHAVVGSQRKSALHRQLPALCKFVSRFCEKEMRHKSLIAGDEKGDWFSPRREEDLSIGFYGLQDQFREINIHKLAVDLKEPFEGSDFLKSEF